MGNCLGTSGAAGIGSDIDAAYKQVDSFKPSPHWLYSVGVHLKQRCTRLLQTPAVTIKQVISLGGTIQAKLPHCQLISMLTQ